jgi:hypothetical protein
MMACRNWTSMMRESVAARLVSMRAAALSDML